MKPTHRITTAALLIAGLLATPLAGCDGAKDKPADNNPATQSESAPPAKPQAAPLLGERHAAPSNDKPDGDTDAEDPLPELPTNWGELNDETRRLIALVIKQAQGGTRAVDGVFQAFAGLTDGRLHQYGKMGYDQRLASGEIVRKGPYVERAERLAQDILKLGKRNFKYTISVVDSPVVNAFATAGGYVYLHTGLMDALDDDQLRFVIGHEVGHIELRHTDSVLTYADRMGLLAGDDAASIVAMLLSQHIGVGYSEAQELEADAWGINKTRGLGVTADDAIKTFEILAKSAGESLEEEKEAETILEELERQRDHHYRTHPASRERIAQARSLAEQ